MEAWKLNATSLENVILYFKLFSILPMRTRFLILGSILWFFSRKIFIETIVFHWVLSKIWAKKHLHFIPSPDSFCIFWLVPNVFIVTSPSLRTIPHVPCVLKCYTYGTNLEMFVKWLYGSISEKVSERVKSEWGIYTMKENPYQIWSDRSDDRGPVSRVRAKDFLCSSPNCTFKEVR